MATFTVRPEGIIRQPALTMPGNATGSEAACTALTASQIRTLLSLGATSDVTFDIVRATTSVQTPLVNNASAALTLGNSTYGVTVPGAMGLGSANTSGKQLEVNGTGDVYLRSTYPAVQYLTANNSQAYTSWFADKFRIGTWDGVAWREAFIIEKTAPDNSLVISSTGAATFSRAVNITAAGNRNLITTNTDASGSCYVKTVNGNGRGISFGNEYESPGGVPGSKWVIYDDAAAAYRLIITPRDATFSGDISMSRTSAQGYIRAWSENGVCNISIRGVASNQGYIETNIGSIIAIPYSGLFGITAGDGASTPKCRTYSTSTTKWIEQYHDGTNGILSTSSGNLNLAPTGGTVAVTGGITASGVVSHGAYTVATLPSAASNAGKMAQVTDSSVAASGNYGATVAAGGANRVKVFSDGTNWVIA